MIPRPAASDVVSPQCSSLFSHVFDMEPPITEAEGAVAALARLVESGGLANVEEPVVYLVGQLQQHIKEERDLFTTLFIAAGGSEA